MSKLEQSKRFIIEQIEDNFFEEKTIPYGKSISLRCTLRTCNSCPLADFAKRAGYSSIAEFVTVTNLREKTNNCHDVLLWHNQVYKEKELDKKLKTILE
jgi:hypothetical protein